MSDNNTGKDGGHDEGPRPDKHRNPYATNPKKSYKDALLHEANDTVNRMGINSFKLLYLLQKRKPEEKDDDSAHSDVTNNQDNSTTWSLCRMRFQVTLMDTTPDTFMEDLSDHINKILEVININTPGVALAPWHSVKVHQSELITALSADPLEAVKYLYGFKAGLDKPGPQYFRINVAFPAIYTAEDIVRRNKNSIMIPGKQTLLIANSQCVNPVTIGWLLRSTPSMADFCDLARVLKHLWNVKGDFGMYWATVKDGKAYNASTASRAIHIEAEEQEAAILIQKAEKTYGRASNNLEDYPLGINMMFVQPFNIVKGSAKALVTKLATYQQTNVKMLISSSWFGEMALERSISNDTFMSLRQWLMSVTSLTPKKTRTGQGYNDKLFTSIHRSEDSQEIRFYFYKVNKVEAMNVISALPLFVRDELGLDPACFFHLSDFKHILDGTWDKEKREYKDHNMINQEQYLLEDCFNVNKEFFPQTIVMENKDTTLETDKHMAMANGEDDVSILSSLTEKTLKAATTVPDTAGRNDDGASVESGMTSKSKTQLAVRTALKEVSAEHHKAMAEQQKKFEQEIALLRKALEQNSVVTNQQATVLKAPRETQQTTTPENDTNNTNTTHEAPTGMDLEDSSDDMSSIPSVRCTSKISSLSAANEALASPEHKRPKRSQSKHRTGRGGRTSSSTKSNV